MSATSTTTAKPRFTGKTALVTGGSTGIGLAAAKKLAALGARVAVTGADSEELAAALRELPQGSLAIRADAGVLHDTTATMAQVRETFGRLDILFINATVVVPGPRETEEDTYLEKIFDVNFKGTLFTIQQAVPLMQRGGSVILNTSWLNPASWQDKVHTPILWILSATKAAVRAFAQAELEPRGIRMNAVNSGPAAPSRNDESVLGGERLHQMTDRLQDQMPLGYLVSWDEVVDAVVFLASDESFYMLGSELVVDGPISQI